jgi:hypothetical protein
MGEFLLSPLITGGYPEDLIKDDSFMSRPIAIVYQKACPGNNEPRWAKQQSGDPKMLLAAISLAKQVQKYDGYPPAIKHSMVIKHSMANLISYS